MSVLIRIGDFITQALEKTVKNLKQRQSGLLVPADYIAGKHFGGFQGYEPWIQECIRDACANAKGIGPEELPEITATTYWFGPGNIMCYFHKHKDALQNLETVLDRIAEKQGITESLSAAAKNQYARVQGGRELGTLMVISLNVAEEEKSGKLMSCVSAWRPSDIEEAKAVPRQQYLIG